MTLFVAVASADGVPVEFAQKAACGMCNDCADCSACCAKGMCAMDNKKEAANVETVMLSYQKVCSGGDFSFLDTLLTPDYREYQVVPGMPPDLKGSAATKMMIQTMREAFPDLEVTPEGLYARGNDVVARFRVRGTHTGNLMGMPPTGKKINITGTDWFRFKDGKWVEHWGIVDGAGMMRQLGMIPEEMPGATTPMNEANTSKNTPGANMSPQDAEKVVRRFVKAVNERNFDAAAELLAPGFVDHSPSWRAETTEMWKERMRTLNNAFPDLNAAIEDLFVVGDKVISRWTYTGTNTGELMGMPPTGKRVQVSSIMIDRVRGGKIHEHWENWDELGFMAQLGQIPMGDETTPHEGK